MLTKRTSLSVAPNLKVIKVDDAIFVMKQGSIFQKYSARNENNSFYA